MRDYLAVVARPKGVVEAFMSNDLVCRTGAEDAQIRPLARPQVANRGQGAHLYFIKIAKGRGPVKIGRANDPQARLATLQVASPYGMKLLGVLENCGDAEIKWHLFLGAHRMRGEWFAWSKAVEGAVKLALDGGDWRSLIAKRWEEAPLQEDDWRIGSPLYAGNPKYPQFQDREA